VALLKWRVLVKVTDYAAWWGAAIATLVLFWDIYKWAVAGPKLDVRVSSNMEFLGDAARSGQTYITVRISNTGDRSSTIENMGFTYFNSKFHYMLRKPDSHFFVNNSGIPNPLPHELSPGKIWDGAALQDSRLEDLVQRGIVVLCIHHSHSKRPICKRVIIRLKPTDLKPAH
jgi:hypothetical protein